MERNELEQKIASELAEREGRVLNRNALSALFGMFSDPIGSLGKIFIGRADAIDAEKHRLEQTHILDMLCSIDDLLRDLQSKAAKDGIIIDGLIETTVENAVEVIGFHVTGDAGNVVIRPGTCVKTHVGNAEKVTGFKVGGR
ncbi:hypothetical protein [Pseudomonas syringae pv. coryli]|uniref:hypothetical protein n=1 Tax=Pseudomonas syringae pv. coryli TaxID=317659 RepID=UPI000619270B|nr:hypothetical protein [Pseudomonas syringae pv. coryli]